MILIWLTCCSELTVTSCSYRVPNSFNVVVHWHSMISHPARLCHCSYAHSCCQVCVKPSHWSPRSTEENSQCLPVPALLYSDVQRSQNPLWNEAWECELITVLHMTGKLHLLFHVSAHIPPAWSYHVWYILVLVLLSYPLKGAVSVEQGISGPPFFDWWTASWKLEFNNLLKINTVNATCGITHPLVNCACCTVPHLLHPHVNCKSGLLWNCECSFPGLRWCHMTMRFIYL